VINYIPKVSVVTYSYRYSDARYSEIGVGHGKFPANPFVGPSCDVIPLTVRHRHKRSVFYYALGGRKDIVNVFVHPINRRLQGHRSSRFVGAQIIRGWGSMPPQLVT